MLDTVPWFVGHPGAQHSAESARMLAYMASGGREGIVSAADMRVSALPVPGSAVVVQPGAVAVLNRAAGQQTYIARVVEAENVAIAADWFRWRSHRLDLCDNSATRHGRVAVIRLLILWLGRIGRWRLCLACPLALLGCSRLLVTRTRRGTRWRASLCPQTRALSLRRTSPTFGRWRTLTVPGHGAWLRDHAGDDQLDGVHAHPC